VDMKMLRSYPGANQGFGARPREAVA
jgi:hypothetical protein